jgi:heat shock protein HslJ
MRRFCGSIPAAVWLLCCGLFAGGMAGCMTAQAAPSAANALEQRAAAAAKKPDSPIGVDWLFTWVEGFSGNTADLIPLPGFILTPEGRTLSGNSSCNRFRAGYLLDEPMGRLSFTNLVNTRMMCQRANAEAENAILAALIATDAFRLEDGTLELRSKGRTVARLVAK